MSRWTATVDRGAALGAGAGLVALGLATVAWSRGHLNAGQPWDIGAATDLVNGQWWPWISAVAGILLIVLGVWWIVAHRRRSGTGRVGLVTPQGRADHLLTADLAPVARAAADALQEHPSVTRAKAVISVERAVPTVSLTATVPARQGLRQALDAVDSTADTLAVMLGPDVAVRTVVRVDGKDRRAVVQ